ncbi:MAG: transcriptional repressor [Campylobacterota bacterium]|nr:transcriptional repressor [Campylobacterota bacterium]
MNNYTQVLREHNLKATPQRLAILETICLNGHINIDKLYEDIKLKFDSISLATIYKNINAMTKSMLLFEVKLPNEKSVYEIVKDNHSHLLCKECGEVQDIYILILKK